MIRRSFLQATFLAPLATLFQWQEDPLTVLTREVATNPEWRHGAMVLKGAQRGYLTLRFRTDPEPCIGSIGSVGPWGPHCTVPSRVVYQLGKPDPELQWYCPCGHAVGLERV